MLNPNVPVYDVNFADPDVLQDPYPAFAKIRELGDVVYNPSADRYMVAGYDNVRSIVLDDEHFVPESSVWERLYGGAVMESMEDPRHAEVRSIWAPAFRVAALNRDFRPEVVRVVREHLAELADRLQSGEVVDIVPSVTRSIATTLLAMQMTVDPEAIQQFLVWGGDMAKTLEALTERDRDRAAELEKVGAKATSEACRFARAEIEKHLASGESGDIIGMLAHHPVAETMTEAEQNASIAQLIVAGYDNLTHALSHVLMVLGKYPEQRDAIRADPDLIVPTVEEILRWRTSSAGDSRVVRGDVRIGDTPVADGTILMILFAAANHDPKYYPEPDRFDIHRPVHRHLAFGLGTHVCLGIGLTRIEAQVLLAEALEMLPSYRVVDREVKYGPPLFMRGPVALNIQLESP